MFRFVMITPGKPATAIDYIDTGSDLTDEVVGEILDTFFDGDTDMVGAVTENLTLNKAEKFAYLDQDDMIIRIQFVEEADSSH
jgi:hypothetical protein